MIRNSCFTLFSLSLIFGFANAKAETNSKPAESDIYKVTLLLKEDFAQFLQGAEDNPAEGYVEDEQEWIPTSFTPTSGRWSGKYVQQAGGCAYIGHEGGLSGALSSPTLRFTEENADLPVIVTLRARKPENSLSLDYITCDMLDVTTDIEHTIYFQRDYGKDYTDWKEYRFVYDDPRKIGTGYIFQFYGFDCGAYVDDIEIKFLRPYVDAPTAKAHSDFDENGFTANWDKTENADHYLISLFTINKDRDKTRSYIYEDIKAEGNSHKFTIDTFEKQYYYTVKAVKGDRQSPESNAIKVEALTKPVNLSATQSDNNLILRWDAVPGIAGVERTYYEVTINRKHTAAVDEEFIIASEDFNDIVWNGYGGTGKDPLSPLYPYDEQEEYDGSTGLAGWAASHHLGLEGAFGLDGTFKSYYNESVYLESPVWDLSAAGGKVNLKVDILNIDEATGASYKPLARMLTYDAEKLTLTTADQQDFKGTSDEWQTFNLTLTGGTKASAIDICARGGWLYLDNLEISQNMKAGDTIEMLYLFSKPEKNELTIPITKLLDNETISFSVKAVKEVWDDYGFSMDYRVESVPSDTFSYTIGSTGISTAEYHSDTKVFCDKNNIIIINPDCADVKVYNLNGCIIASDTSHKETVVLKAPAAKGILIVKVGSKALKIAI